MYARWWLVRAVMEKNRVNYSSSSNTSSKWAERKNASNAGKVNYMDRAAAEATDAHRSGSAI